MEEIRRKMEKGRGPFDKLRMKRHLDRIRIENSSKWER